MNIGNPQTRRMGLHQQVFDRAKMSAKTRLNIRCPYARPSTRDTEFTPACPPMVAKMKEPGPTTPLLLRKLAKAGHGGAANNKRSAYMTALAFYTFFFLAKETWRAAAWGSEDFQQETESTEEKKILSVISVLLLVLVFYFCDCTTALFCHQLS